MPVAGSVREADRLQYLYKHYFGVEIYVPVKVDIAPSAPSSMQQSVPTSAYGQTIPVIYGKARVPSSYIWAMPIDVDTDGDDVSVRLTARLRFAAPLVANSNWRVRRLWADTKLIYDASTGTRSPALEEFRVYDGQASQGRDSLMIEAEGENEVSAHRGYLDIVIRMDLGAAADAVPVFDAEWIQDAETGVQIDDYSTFFSDVVDTVPQAGAATFWGYSSDANLIRRFNTNTLQETYAVSLVPLVLGRTYADWYDHGFRYVPEIDRILAFGRPPGVDQEFYGVVINPMTGEIVVESDDGIGPVIVYQSCHVRFANASIIVGSTYNNHAVFVYRFSATQAERTYLSGSNWRGYSAIECMAPGQVRADEADVWVAADNDLLRLIVSTSGGIGAGTVHATFASNLRYCVWHDNDVIVWTASGQAIRVDGATGAVVWTQAVPYQVAEALTRGLAPPDMNRFEGTFFYQEDDNYNFTSLDTGETEEVDKISSIYFRYAYDSDFNWLIDTDNVTVPRRTIFDATGDGTIRDLEDFIAAVTEYGEGFSAAEHDEINITDQIQGAVIDVTSGVRDVVKSVAGPYAFAIFERAGQIICKRALTDGAIVIDATLAGNDLVDRGGQAIRARRLNPEEFIARYGINYRDPAEIYQARTQYGEIQFTPFPLSPTDLSVKTDIPVIMDADTIKTLATKKVNRLAEEKHEFTMTLRAKFCDLEPEDIIRFDYAGRTVTARVVETSMNPDFSIDVRATEFLSAVASTVAGATGRPVEPSAAGMPESLYYHLDIPLQSDADDLEGLGLVQYHVLTSQGQPAWDGARLYAKSSAGGYSAIATQTEDGLAGVALSALPDTNNPYVTEFLRSIDVAFITGDTSLLSSKTYLEVMNGANKFAIGAPGRWEVCHVIGITDNGNGSFTFTGLVRGRGVSEEHTGSHEAGDFVVWLSGDNVQHVDYGLDSLGDTFLYKPVGFGGNISATASTSAVVTGEAEKIPKPCQLDAAIDGSDIDLDWVRQARIGVVWADDGDFSTPLGESFEQYVLRIKDGPGGTVLRTVTVDDATAYTYPAADIATDFGSMPATLTWDIRQVSGSGVISPTREATIDL